MYEAGALTMVIMPDDTRRACACTMPVKCCGPAQEGPCEIGQHPWNWHSLQRYGELSASCMTWVLLNEYTTLATDTWLRGDMKSGHVMHTLLLQPSILPPFFTHNGDGGGRKGSQNGAVLSDTAGLMPPQQPLPYFRASSDVPMCARGCVQQGVLLT